MAQDYVAREIAESIATRIWTEHDESAIKEIFTEDVFYKDVAWDYTFEGHDGVLTYLRRVKEGIPDFAEEIQQVIDVRPGTIVSHWHYSGTFRSPLIVKEFRCPGYSVITMRGGRVSSNFDYYGAQDFLAALDYVYPTVEALRDREL